jgi:hypothetical protein
MSFFLKRNSPVARAAAKTGFRQSWIITLAWAGLVGCVAVMKFLPQYPAWVDWLLLSLTGLITSYYALKLPVGFVDELNRNESAWNRIPTGGPRVRILFLIAGLILLASGLYKLGKAWMGY